MDIHLLCVTQSIPPALSATLTLCSLCISIKYMFHPTLKNASPKLLGTLMVLALAFAANNGFVYSLTLFIVATLITELDFLEKMAALFWGRDKYWEHKDKILQLTKDEMNARAKAEAQMEVEEVSAKIPSTTEHTELSNFGTPTVSLVDSFASKAKRFEILVIGAIAMKEWPFEYEEMSTYKKITSPSGTFEIDAIIETKFVDYVIDIKYAERPHVIMNVYPIITRNAQAYKDYLDKRGTVKNVIPIAIIPSNIASSTVFNDMPILKFDASVNKFSDVQEFREKVSRLITS